MKKMSGKRMVARNSDRQTTLLFFLSIYYYYVLNHWEVAWVGILLYWELLGESEDK